MEKVVVLEGQWRAAQDKFKHKKRSVRQVEEDLQVHTCIIHATLQQLMCAIIVNTIPLK